MFFRVPDEKQKQKFHESRKLVRITLKMLLYKKKKIKNADIFLISDIIETSLQSIRPFSLRLTAMFAIRIKNCFSYDDANGHTE